MPLPGSFNRVRSAGRRQDSPFSYVPEAQDYLREGVQGFGEALQPAILKDIGTTLGGLNEMGALRSGGVQVALGDIGQKYADIVGAHAKQATQYGLEAGLGARRQAFEESEAKRKRKHGLLKAIGSVLGAGIGFVASGGNPLGAVAGSRLGGGLGGGQEASDATYDTSNMG